MSRSTVRVVLVILAVFLLVAGIVGGFVWWKISGLKESLVRGLGSALNAQVQVASLDLNIWGGEMHAAGITLTNERADAPWEKGAISQATVRFHLFDLLGSTLPLTVDVSSWSLVLHPTTSAAAGSEPAQTSSTTAPTKSRVQVTQLTVHDGSVKIELADNHEVDIEGVSFNASVNAAGLWTTDLQATSIKAGALEAQASSVLIHGENDKATFSNLRMVCGQGLIAGDGEVALGGDHQAKLTLHATDIAVNMLVAVEWQMKVSGLISGDVVYEGNELAGTATGKLTLNQPKFNLLPWLGKITVLVGLPDISDVELDKATTDFEWKEHTFHLTNLDIRKNGVTRLGGAADIDPTGQIDAKLKLGLPSTVTAKWPQLQEKVFTTQLDDFNWADVHVTGTPDHLQEDLTGRVVAVGVDQGSGLIESATQKAADFLKNMMGN